MGTAGRTLRSFTLISGLCAAVAGCHGSPPLNQGPDGGGSPDTTVGGADTGADTGVATPSGMIGPAGGQATGPGGASVSVPAGALAAPAKIEIGAVTGGSPAVPTLPALVEPAGAALALTPHGQSFAGAVTVRIPFDATLAARAGTRPLRLYTAAPGGAWTAVDGARVTNGAVEADVMHFSYFIVGYEAPGQTVAGGSRKLDLLFMVDTSLSMQPLQTKLLANFPTLIQTLKDLAGGLPDIHIGVVSSNMGAGQFSVPQCLAGGDGGRLQSAPRGACTQGINGAFIAAGENESTKNYPGTIEEAFTCIAALGDGGCGFEHQLESVAVALGARGTMPPENAGFLRSDALLGIVLITNEDDCSAPPDAALFDPSQAYISDPLGPLSSYRCNEFGHRCAGAAPPRIGTEGSAVTLSDCHSAEDGVLNRVSDYVQLFKGLKADTNQVFVAAITGPSTPYAVQWTPPMNNDTLPWPYVVHSCMQTTGEYADPAVRIAELINAFGANGILQSICGDSFAPALNQIGAALAQHLGPRCLQPAVVGGTAGAPSLQTGCAVYESTPAGGGLRVETALPACGATGVQPCYSVGANAACGTDGAEITVTRGTPPPADSILVVRCG